MIADIPQCFLFKKNSDGRECIISVTNDSLAANQKREPWLQSLKQEEVSQEVSFEKSNLNVYMRGKL